MDKRETGLVPADKLNQAKVIAIVVASVLALFFGFHFFIEVVSWLTVMLWFAAGLAVAGVLGYAGYLIAVKPRLPQIAKKAGKYKVYDTHRKQVYLFRSRPSVADLAQVSDELHLAVLELRGDVFALRNEEPVEVLEDEGKESVRVRIKSAEKNSPDQEGWVCRSSLVAE